MRLFVCASLCFSCVRLFVFHVCVSLFVCERVLASVCLWMRTRRFRVSVSVLWFRIQDLGFRCNAFRVSVSVLWLRI